MLANFALLAFIATGQTAAAPAAPNCADANHRAFDFWVGEWEVFDTASNTRVARSTISKDAGGCVVHERYEQTVGPGNAPIDYHGRSYSAFDTADGKWRQFYVDSGGRARLLTGGLVDGAMVLSGLAPGGAGRSRMTVRPQPDGSVRQSGDFSTDEGVTWKPGYDFTYRKR